MRMVGRQCGGHGAGWWRSRVVAEQATVGSVPSPVSIARKRQSSRSPTPPKYEPKSVMVVLPASGPATGSSEETRGAGYVWKVESLAQKSCRGGEGREGRRRCASESKGGAREAQRRCTGGCDRACALRPRNGLASEQVPAHLD